MDETGIASAFLTTDELQNTITIERALREEEIKTAAELEKLTGYYRQRVTLRTELIDLLQRALDRGLPAGWLPGYVKPKAGVARVNVRPEPNTSKPAVASIPTEGLACDFKPVLADTKWQNIRINSIEGWVSLDYAEVKAR